MTLEILDWHDGDLLAKPVFDGSIFADIPGVQFVSALGRPRG